MIERAVSLASEVPGWRTGRPAAQRAVAAAELAATFPLAPWELGGEHPAVFRPHGHAWHQARGAVAAGARTVTVTGLWEDGRRGAVVLFRSDDGAWLVTERWRRER